jgi:hypothetical protein
MLMPWWYGPFPQRQHSFSITVIFPILLHNLYVLLEARVGVTAEEENSTTERERERERRERKIKREREREQWHTNSGNQDQPDNVVCCRCTVFVNAFISRK